MDKFIPLARPDINNEEIDIVIETLKSGWLTTGPKVTEFEEELVSYIQKDEPLHAVGLNSCTSALFLALLALDIKKGDEVIVPTWTFAATSQVVEWIGATLILCDIEKETLNIDVDKAELLITDKTKAIIPVHIAGFPCNMEKISILAKKYDLKIIEDAAHAIGTKYQDKKIGNFADVTCFSFYATKNLAMGEGGAAISSNKKTIDKIRKLSYFGIDKEASKRYEQTGKWFYDIEHLGYKCNLDSMHAAMGLIQLKKLDMMNIRRREIASYYRRNLSDKLEFFIDSSEHYHTYHLFPIKLPLSINRNQFIELLKEQNIGASVHFIPLHKHSFYSQRFSSNKFPVANEVYERTLSIPMCSAMTNEEMQYVVQTINRLLG